MAWSIAEVARMSKVTSRTLRYYDAIGLLRPAYVHRNGLASRTPWPAPSPNWKGAAQ